MQNMVTNGKRNSRLNPYVSSVVPSVSFANVVKFAFIVALSCSLTVSCVWTVDRVVVVLVNVLA